MTVVRPATETIVMVDASSAAYRDPFKDVQSFDHFPRLHGPHYQGIVKITTSH